MNKRSSAPARAFAAIALLCGVFVLVAVIASSLGEGEKDGGDGRSPAAQTAGQRDGKAPKAYVVQNGDTLTSIARKTGVPVARIEDLNPGVDPQILVSGEKLKLR